MASKIWKKLLFIILIIACLFNIMLKLVNRNSLKAELQASAQYVQDLIIKKESEKAKNNTENNISGNSLEGIFGNNNSNVVNNSTVQADNIINNESISNNNNNNNQNTDTNNVTSNSNTLVLKFNEN